MKDKILPLTVLKRLTSGHDELIIDLINPEWSVSRWGSSIQCGHHKCHIHPQARNWHKVTRQQLMDGLKSKHYQQRLVFFWQCWRCVRRKWRRPDHRAWISLQVNFSFWVFLNKMLFQLRRHFNHVRQPGLWLQRSHQWSQYLHP